MTVSPMTQDDLVHLTPNTSAVLRLVSLSQHQSLRFQATRLVSPNGSTDPRTVVIVEVTQSCAIQMLVVSSLKRLRVSIRPVIAEFLIGVMAPPHLRL